MDQIEEKLGYIGITDYAQAELGISVYWNRNYNEL